MSSDLQAEVDRLRVEVEDLKARLTLAKANAGPARRSRPDGRFSSRSPAEQAAFDAEARAYLDGKVRAAGFDPSTEQGREAYLAAAYRKARGEPEPAAPIYNSVGNSAEPAPPASDDPMSVYLPRDVATPAGIARAAAIADGTLVDLPQDPLARAIITAAAKARGE